MAKLNQILFKSLLSFLLLFCSMAVSAGEPADNGSIKGKVTTIDNKPAAAVTVMLKGTKKASITDDDGNFMLHNIAAGHYEIEVSLVGYEPLVQTVIVEENKTVYVSLQLKLSQSQLQEVTVSTSLKTYTTNKISESLRLNQELIEVPQNISVATAQTIKDLGAVSSSEIMRTSAGISALGANQDIGISIRGTEMYYSILRNGVGAGYWYNMELDPGMIERAEFIKGPAGYMVSNTEPGGLANFVTKQPTHEKIVAVNFGFGSWNMMRTTVDLGGEFKKGGSLTYRLNAGYQQQDAFYDFGYLKKYYVAGALKFEVDKNTDLSFEYNYVRGHQLSDGHTLQTIDGKRVLPDKFAVVDPNTDGTVSADHYFRFHAKHKLSDNWNLNAQAAYVFGPWGGYMMGINYEPVVNDSLYRQTWLTDWRNRLFTAQAFLDGTFNTGSMEHKVLIGIDYGDNWTRSTGGGDWSGNPALALDITDPVYYLDEAVLKDFDPKDWDNIWGNHYSALYLQYNVKFFKKLIVTLAGRYTSNVTWSNYSDPYVQTDKRVTPRLGLTWMFTDNISAYALYDQAFVPQSGRSFTGQVFNPLTGDDKEIGFKSFWLNKKLSANATAYRVTKNNVLTTDPQHPDFQVQTGQITSKGIEVDINGNLTKGLNIMANYAYTDSRVTKSNDSTQLGLYSYGSAKNMANLFAKYRFSEGLLHGFSIGGGVQYVGKRTYAYDATKMHDQMMPAYTLLEATIGYTLRNFYVNLNAYNLANKKYITNGYAIDDVDYSYNPGEPVNFRIDFGINF
ncbi:TonB-dependent siderophore receptor [Parafilimonas sp.]|uniref:TonB-dependent siderophore receptor n=1 Tax=Parafilimonas sp. TaxID=1969739 RepID=UPI0039E2C942